MNGITQEKLTGSRRSFFTKTAAIIGASALAGQILNAQTTTTPTSQTDIDVLNYALALEHLEAAFYTQGVARYSANDFNNGIYAPIFGSKINGNVPSYLQTIKDHEVAHVAALQATITQLGGTPVAPCTYNFALNNVNDFLAVALILENTGVMAYDGALNMISNADLKQTAATIAMVEARHASYLAVLNGQIPFPSAFDTAKGKNEILAAAATYITSCPGGGPTSNPSGPTISGLRTAITTTENEISFDFTQSAAADGSAVSVMFVQVSGPQTAIIAGRTANPRVLLQGGKGVYVFEVTVMDGRGTRQTGRTTVTYV